jgi:hypothetical protein
MDCSREDEQHLPWISSTEKRELREEAAPYKTLFGVKNDDIAALNTYFWNLKAE